MKENVISNHLHNWSKNWDTLLMSWESYCLASWALLLSHTRCNGRRWDLCTGNFKNLIMALAPTHLHMEFQTPHWYFNNLEVNESITGQCFWFEIIRGRYETNFFINFLTYPQIYATLLFLIWGLSQCKYQCQIPKNLLSQFSDFNTEMSFFCMGSN